MSLFVINTKESQISSAPQSLRSAPHVSNAQPYDKTQTTHQLHKTTQQPPDIFIPPTRKTRSTSHLHQTHHHYAETRSTPKCPNNNLGHLIHPSIHPQPAASPQQ